MIREANTRPASDVIDVAVRPVLGDFSFERIADADSPDERRAIIDERKELLRPRQEYIASVVQGLGGTVLARHWLSGVVIASVPAGSVASLAADAHVDSISPGWSDPTITGGSFDGDDTRNATRAANLLAHSPNYDAEWGGRVSTPTNQVKIGIIEPQGINGDHVGWLDATGFPSRVTYRKCTSSACVLTSPSPPTTPHGTQVAWFAAGSIEQGQDSNYPGLKTADQRRRSGIAKEADIYYYKANGACALAQAIQSATADGADVLNLSLAQPCGFDSCDTATNCCGMNEAMKAALDAGVLIAACAGNCAPAQRKNDCDTWYPGARSENMAVGLLNSDDAVAYDKQTELNTCYGPWQIVTRGGYQTWTPAVDVLAPGHNLVNYFAAEGANSYGTTTIWGCSFATPIVAGAVALLRQAFNDIGWSGNNAKALFVNAMAMADASDGTVAGESNYAVSPMSGYGRFRAHWPHADNPDLVAPWAWGWRSFDIESGETVTWTVGSNGPESPAITEWKWAFLWFEEDLGSTSDVTIQVIDDLNCDGVVSGSDPVVAADMSYALRKRIHLSTPDIAGRCLVMRARGWNTPPGGVRVFSADYYHSGNGNLH